MSKELMKRCDECDEIKFGFAGFDIKIDESDEWVWICDQNECVQAWLTKKGVSIQDESEEN